MASLKPNPSSNWAVWSRSRAAGPLLASSGTLMLINANKNSYSVIQQTLVAQLELVKLSDCSLARSNRTFMYSGQRIYSPPIDKISSVSAVNSHRDLNWRFLGVCSASRNVIAGVACSVACLCVCILLLGYLIHHKTLDCIVWRKIFVQPTSTSMSLAPKEVTQP